MEDPGAQLHAIYIVADVSVAPWPVPAAEHTLAIAKGPNNRQAEKADVPQNLPFRAWLMYRLRFISASDICGAWLPFGGNLRPAE